ncbi:nitroreductase family protein [Naematelia encephala]|uniref:Nitroreductase family protein n=1 Tax=Naematelia encephala TaxID=71784 RepID=A0A1Y2AG26_9TREE|nr:nitroreductase family protein [Naematelia encephala]
MSISDLLAAYAHRRSHYLIGPQCPISHAELEDVVYASLRHVPSMFNMQSTRIIILYDIHHKALWDLCEESLSAEIRARVPNVASEHFPTVQDKIDRLREGYGTILFFEDEEVIRSCSERYPAYTKAFPTWSLQSAAIAQYAIWLALDISGLGLTLQHYQPSLAAIREKWGVPESWTMTGQMPFGSLAGLPVEKNFKHRVEIMTVFGVD